MSANREGPKRKAYTEVGDEGIDAGEREPRRPVRRCWEALWESLCSFGAVERFALEVTCRSSLAFESGAAGGVFSTCKGRRGLREGQRTIRLLSSERGHLGGRAGRVWWWWRWNAGLQQPKLLYLEQARDLSSQAWRERFVILT